MSFNLGNEKSCSRLPMVIVNLKEIYENIVFKNWVGKVERFI